MRTYVRTNFQLLTIVVKLYSKDSRPFLLHHDSLIRPPPYVSVFLQLILSKHEQRERVLIVSATLPINRHEKFEQFISMIDFFINYLKSYHPGGVGGCQSIIVAFFLRALWSPVLSSCLPINMGSSSESKVQNPFSRLLETCTSSKVKAYPASSPLLVVVVVDLVLLSQYLQHKLNYFLEMLKISPPKKEKEKKRALFLKEKFFV